MPVFTGLCVSLDSGAIHNWKALVHHLHDYMMTDICASSALLSRELCRYYFDQLVVHGATFKTTYVIVEAMCTQVC